MRNAHIVSLSLSRARKLQKQKNSPENTTFKRAFDVARDLLLLLLLKRARVLALSLSLSLLSSVLRAFFKRERAEERDVLNTISLDSLLSLLSLSVFLNMRP